MIYLKFEWCGSIARCKWCSARRQPTLETWGRRAAKAGFACFWLLIHSILSVIVGINAAVNLSFIWILWNVKQILILGNCHFVSLSIRTFFYNFCLSGCFSLIAEIATHCRSSLLTEYKNHSDYLYMLNFNPWKYFFFLYNGLLAFMKASLTHFVHC